MTVIAIRRKVRYIRFIYINKILRVFQVGANHVPFMAGTYGGHISASVGTLSVGTTGKQTPFSAVRFEINCAGTGGHT